MEEKTLPLGEEWRRHYRGGRMKKTLASGQNGEDTAFGAEWRKHNLGGRMEEKILSWGQNGGKDTSLHGGRMEKKTLPWGQNGVKYLISLLSNLGICCSNLLLGRWTWHWTSTCWLLWTNF